MKKYYWYLDITPNEMFSLYDYPIPGKDGLPLCEKHSNKLEMLEVVIFDREASELCSGPIKLDCADPKNWTVC
jgi:hypothetical protein